MGAMVATISKRGENVVPQVVLMLKELKHRGATTHEIATPNSDIVIGLISSQIPSKEYVKPALNDGYAFVFEGHAFPSSDVPKVERFLKETKSDIQKNGAKIIRELEGSYVFCIASSDILIVGRDFLGTSPLYYGENETAYAVASERKALWKIGIKNAKSFPPGNLARIDAKGFTFRPIKTIRQPSIKSVGIESAAKHLQKLLTEATRKRVSDVDKVAVAFSGGLDSCVIAVLAKLCKKELHLISVGLDDQEEIQHAKAVAETLNIFHHVQTYRAEQVKEVLPKALWLIEQPNVINVSIAIPFYWISDVASQLGCRVMLAGQGCDELFGGYQRYLSNYRQSIESVYEAIYHDVTFSYETNFQRDSQICAFNKVELRLPFVDSKVIQYALSLPVNLKIESAEDPLRKRVLRKVAQKLKLPPSTVNRRKKAIQYATGVDKVLRKLAKGEGLTLQEYIERVFQNVYPKVKV